jgi:hypothetical protein
MVRSFLISDRPGTASAIEAAFQTLAVHATYDPSLPICVSVGLAAFFCRPLLPYSRRMARRTFEMATGCSSFPLHRQLRAKSFDYRE